MLNLPILLTASLHESRLWEFQSPTHVSESSVVSWCCKISCQGSPSNPIAFFGRKDWRREGAKKVSGRLQLLEEINTWQKQRRKEREPSHWPGSRGGCGSCLRSLGRRRRPTRAKKKRPGAGGPGLGDTGSEGTWIRNQRG